MRQIAFVCFLLGFSTLVAADPKPLGEVGKELFKEKFTAAELSSSWKKGPGTYSVSEGVLTIREKKDDMHVAALRAMVPVQDTIVECEFKLDGAKTLHVGFDPASGELPGRTGHLVNLIITPKSMQIQKPKDKEKPEITAKTLAKLDAPLEEGKWHTLRLAMVGTKMQAIIDNKHFLEGDDPELKVKKPAVIFRVGGESVSIKNLTVSGVK
jgi:hypothetical protein